MKHDKLYQTRLYMDNWYSVHSHELIRRLWLNAIQAKLNTRENRAVCFGFNYCLFLQHSGRVLNCDTQAEECLFAAVLEQSGLQEHWHIPMSPSLSFSFSACVWVCLSGHIFHCSATAWHIMSWNDTDIVIMRLEAITRFIPGEVTNLDENELTTAGGGRIGTTNTH